MTKPHHAAMLHPPAVRALAPVLNIAMVTETYPPEVNGVAHTLARLVGELRGKGHRLGLVRPAQGGEIAGTYDAGSCTLLARGLPIPGYPQLRFGLPQKALLRQYWMCERPDLVHIATPGPLGHAALEVAQALGLRVVSDFRTNFHAYARHYHIGWLQRPVMALMRKFHNRTLATFVPTQALRSELAADGFERVEAVGRGVDTEAFNPAYRSDALRATWGAGPADRVCIYVGRLAAEKNLDLLVSTWRRVEAAAPQSRLVLVGDGPLKASLMERLPGAFFAGSQKGLMLASHYASGDVFLFPSLSETFGNVTTEAMASGLAVVAFDHAAAGQFVTSGLHGRLVPPAQAGAFVESAVELAMGDPVWVKQLGSNARQRVLGMGWAHIATQMEDHYRRVLNPGWPATTLPLPDADAFSAFHSGYQM